MLDRMYLMGASTFVWFMIGLFTISNSIIWIIEDINGMEHKAYWFDHVSVIIHLLLLGLGLWFINNSKDKWDIVKYKKVKDLLEDNDTIVYKKKVSDE